MGFEPTNGGFADLSLGPLGYRARARQYIEKRWSMSVARAEYEDIVEANEAQFHATDVVAVTCASRRKRADSSGGVGQM